MSTWIALFRGINVGGKHILPMKTLSALLEELGCEDVKTYIQSGNVVFRSKARGAKKLAQSIRDAIGEAHGFTPEVLLLTPAELESATAANPFPEGEGEPKTLHLSFLAADPKAPNLESLEKLRAPSERFGLKGRVFYLHAPDGIGKSKLAAKVEKALGVSATSRNWRTVSKLRELSQA